MSNVVQYILSKCSTVEPSSLSDSLANDTSGNCVLYIRRCSEEGFSLDNSNANDVSSNSITYGITSCQRGCVDLDNISLDYWRSIPQTGTPITPVDIYGALGFTQKSEVSETYIEVCPIYCYCDGPVADGVTSTGKYDRYVTRWRGEYVNNRIYYGTVGGTRLQAPVQLFPEFPVVGIREISLSFDQNARPCFAFTNGDGKIYLRRFVAGVPTFYDWVGDSPKLFFNGIVQVDDSIRDVVCYYLSNGVLMARFQRENFTVPYSVVTGVTGLTAVFTDRQRSTASSYHSFELIGSNGEIYLLSVLYPPWPTLAFDYATSSAEFTGDGDYQLVVIATASDDSLTSTAIFLTDGDYSPSSIIRSESDSTTATAALLTDGSYLLVVVSDSESDSLTSTASFTSDGDYYLSVVSGGSYTDTQTATAAFSTDGDYTV